MRRVLSLLLIWLIVGCAEKQPELTIDDDTLIDALVDIHMLEQSVMRTDYRVRDSIAEAIRFKIAEVHNLSDEELEWNIETLQELPEKHTEIYTEVVARLDSIANAVGNPDQTTPGD